MQTESKSSFLHFRRALHCVKYSARFCTAVYVTQTDNLPDWVWDKRVYLDRGPDSTKVDVAESNTVDVQKKERNTDSVADTVDVQKKGSNMDSTSCISGNGSTSGNMESVHSGSTYPPLPLCLANLIKNRSKGKLGLTVREVEKQEVTYSTVEKCVSKISKETEESKKETEEFQMNSEKSKNSEKSSIALRLPHSKIIRYISHRPHTPHAPHGHKGFHVLNIHSTVEFGLAMVEEAQNSTFFFDSTNATNVANATNATTSANVASGPQVDVNLAESLILAELRRIKILKTQSESQSLKSLVDAHTKFWNHSQICETPQQFKEKHYEHFRFDFCGTNSANSDKKMLMDCYVTGEMFGRENNLLGCIENGWKLAQELGKKMEGVGVKD